MEFNLATTLRKGLLPALSGSAADVLLGDGTWGAVPGSGTYTPTLTNVTNLAASTAYLTNYVRIGSMVIVSGKVDVDPTAAASTVLDISVPIASNFGSTEDGAGAAFSRGTAGEGAAMLTDATSNALRMQWVTTEIANHSFWFIAMYRII